MSTHYRKSQDVPDEVLAARLMELALAVSNGISKTSSEFTMRIPTELDRDADCVMAEAANRLKQRKEQAARLSELEAEVTRFKNAAICERDARQLVERQLEAIYALEPKFWVRWRSDGMYEGPLHNAQIEQVRKDGGWSPLIALPERTK